MTYVHFLRPRGGTVTQRTANPCNPVRFRARPPLNRPRFTFFPHIISYKHFWREGIYWFFRGVSKPLFTTLFFIILENCCQAKTVYPTSVYVIYFVDIAFNNRKWLFLRTWWVNDGFGQQGQNVRGQEALPL